MTAIINVRNLNAQTCLDLVTNGGFETFSSAGSNKVANGWSNLNLSFTPDLFNNVANGSGYGVPCNINGYQNAHGGNSYAGLYQGATSSGFPYSWTEGIQTSFSNLMTVGKMYEVSLWVSKADLSINSYDNLRIDIGGGGNTIYYTYTVPPNLSNDKTNWVKVSFPYCAAVGDESFINIYSIANPFGASTTSTTSGCTYTNTNAGAYIYVDDVSVKEINFNVPSQTICANTTVTLAVNTPTNFCVANSTFYTYNWNFGDGSPVVNTGTNIATTHVYATTGNYTGSLTVNTSYCSNTYTYSINVPTINVTIATNTNSICNGINSFTATPSPIGTYSYSWSVKDATTGSIIPTSNYTITGSATNTPTINFATINQNVNVCATITNTLGCSNSGCITLLSCCAKPPNTTKFTNTTFTTSTTLTGTTTVKYQFSGTITVSSGTLTIMTADVTMDPLTRFIVNSGAYLKIQESYIHGCNAMWNGIFALNNSTVEIGVSRVEDGIRTIVDSTGGSTIILKANYFNKNYITLLCRANKSSVSYLDIYSNAFTSSAIPVPTGLPYMPTTPNLSFAPNLYNYNVVNLLPPYQTSKAYTGIQLFNTLQAGATNSMITIGRSNIGIENIFDKLQIGINASNANALIQNNVFQNIKYNTNQGVYNTGVMIYSHSSIALPNAACNVQIGANSINQKNIFIDNDYGIYSRYRNTIYVANNTFSTQTTGFYMETNFGGLTVDVVKNKFTANLKGILFTDNSNVIGNITENRFDNSSATVGTYSTNVGITLSEPTVLTGTPTVYGKYTVYNNYINNHYNGIKTINTFSTQITDNEVHMAQDNTQDHFQSGISAEGSSFANTTNNTVDMTSLNSGSWWHFGIYYVNASSPFINCNNIDKTAVSIKIQGTCSTLANTNEFVNNKMSNAAYGVWLDGGDFNNSQAYWVGATPFAGDNTWTGTMAQRTYVSGNGNASNRFLYTQNGAQYLVAASNSTNTAGSIPFYGNNNSTANASNTCTAQSITPAFKMSSNNNVRLFASAHQIAQSTLIASNITNAANTNHLNKRYLLQNILSQNADLSNDTILTNFMGAIRQTNIGKLNTIDSLFQLATLSDDSTHSICNLAVVQNNAIVPINTIEQNHKQFNRIYADYLNGALSNGQIIQLRKLAVKCPDTDGHAVFQARAVLASFDKTIYYSNCDDDRKNNRMRDDNNLVATDNNQIIVYPNPSSNEINTLLILEEGKSATILIYNLLGELVKQNVLQNGNTKIDMSDLKSGTYIYNIIIDNSSVKNNKLIILK